MMYGDLCALYYDLDVSKNNKKEFDFYECYLKQACGSILEPMCGTGRFLLPFFKARYPIEGFDASAAMLERLHQKAKNQNIQPHVWYGYIQDLVIEKKYALVLIPSGSFNLIFNKKEALQALQALYESLKEGGRLVFEIMTIHFLAKQEVAVWSHTALEYENDKKITLATLHEQPNDCVQKTQCCYVLFDENATVLKVEDEIYNIRFYETKEMDKMLASVGFKAIKKIKAFKYDVVAAPFDEIIVYECSK